MLKCQGQGQFNQGQCWSQFKFQQICQMKTLLNEDLANIFCQTIQGQTQEFKKSRREYLLAYMMSCFTRAGGSICECFITCMDTCNSKNYCMQNCCKTLLVLYLSQFLLISRNFVMCQYTIAMYQLDDSYRSVHENLNETCEKLTQLNKS